MWLTLFDVAGRKALSASVPGSLELTELLMVVVIFAGLPLVSLHGALGSGKTRLVNELMGPGGLGAACIMVECHPGDRASAMRARAERALRCVPGALAQTLAQQSRVLVIDDIQHLRTDEATSLLAALALVIGSWRTRKRTAVPSDRGGTRT